jgi:hypothetical protein
MLVIFKTSKVDFASTVVFKKIDFAIQKELAT